MKHYPQRPFSERLGSRIKDNGLSWPTTNLIMEADFYIQKCWRTVLLWEWGIVGVSYILKIALAWKKRSKSFVMNYSGQIRFIVLLLKHCERYMFVADFWYFKLILGFLSSLKNSIASIHITLQPRRPVAILSVLQEPCSSCFDQTFCKNNCLASPLLQLLGLP